MAINLHHHCSFTPSSSLNSCLTQNSVGGCFSCPRVPRLGYILSNCDNSQKSCIIKLAFLGNKQLSRGSICYRTSLRHSERRRVGRLFLLASTDDGVSVNGSPSTSTSADVEEIRAKLNQSLQGEDHGDSLLQSLHDAERNFELAIKGRVNLSKQSWFPTAWFGIDGNSWVKTLSYQASVYSLLQAACEIASRGDGRDRDTNDFVQRSLFRQLAPLESLVREKLSAKQPEASEWFWSEQVPDMVTYFINCFEADSRFTSAISVFGNGSSSGSGSSSDVSLLLLALTCVAAVIRLGPAKVSCPQFSSTTTEITGRLMDMLVDFISIRQAYRSIKDIGLRREFLLHFGPRAGACRIEKDCSSEEVVFWIDLVQKQLKRAIDREKIWSRVTTSETIEVLEKDLAIFGFFIALGRSTQSFLSANGFDVVDDPINGFIRYLVGGSVLYYPQLSSISSYQLYVEVVCEELDWLPFYPGITCTSKQSHGHRNKREGPPNAEAIPEVLGVCSHWIQSFIKYSNWLENPSHIKAAKFLSRGHNKLMECTEELGISRKMAESSINKSEGNACGAYSPLDRETDSFDKALESVDEALVRLEQLLQEHHVTNSGSGKERLKAACSDLEKIRKLKKEAEFLEASFRAKAAYLQQGDSGNGSKSFIDEQNQHSKGTSRKNPNLKTDRTKSQPQGFWNFMRAPTKEHDLDSTDQLGDDYIEQSVPSLATTESKSNEIRRFELLRNELMELEKRVQRSTDQSEPGEDDAANYRDDSVSAKLLQVQKKESIITKSLDKLKATSTDVLQGTQLLAIDVAAATELLRRAMIGDELADKEKKALRRTMTDLASVVPIGILMLLPVTAVGHAAMLAAIQRYVPSLIPSTYGAERLALLRQLEKVKEIDTNEVQSDESEEVA